MKILVVSAVFPPDIIGGAEVSASNLARWLASQGHEVHVLATAKNPKEACENRLENGLHIWRVWMPRLYPMYYFAEAKSWQKPLWHLQDHLDPRNCKIVARILEKVKPDFANIHVIQGLGYNILKEFSRRNIPVLFFLPDVSLACIRMSMFKNGKDCKGLCPECTCSAKLKWNYLRRLPKLGFCSPSRFNLEKVARYVAIQERPHMASLNANKYPAPTVKAAKRKGVQVLFAGQLSPSKGVETLLQAVENVVVKGKDIRLLVAGKGPLETQLKKRYAGVKWLEFIGFVNHQELANHMAESTVLAIPSVWDENSPGVVIQALGVGLPVLGSDKAGIPELVHAGKNGLLVPPGDVEAWQNALLEVINHPSRVKKWREYALAHAHEFEQDHLGRKILKMIAEIKGEKC